MTKPARHVCPDCGIIYRPKTNQTYCPKCQKRRNWRVVPEPKDLGNCICHHDGMEYKIHECDVRRKLARERKEQGKPYQMPQCADCTPEMAKKVVILRSEKICKWWKCRKHFEGRTDQYYCCNSCASAAARARAKKKKRLAA